MQTNNCTFHVESGCMASNAKKFYHFGRRRCSGERCSLCKRHLRRPHSHPEQWNGELQQFLLQYTDIPDPLHVCVCKKLNIRKGLSGKCKSEFTPRWLKREKNKMKLCCVPGCSVGYELGVHVALRALRQSVLLVMLVFDCCPREYPAMWPVSSCCAQVLFPRQGN